MGVLPKELVVVPAIAPHSESRTLAGRPPPATEQRAFNPRASLSYAPVPRTTSRTRMNARYDAADIEVLSGLDPVKRRPGMYTDTTRPNHLAQEVVDNAVDEALAGHAREIDVVMHADGSCRSEERRV